MSTIQPELLIEVSVECENCGHEFQYESSMGTPDKWVTWTTAHSGVKSVGSEYPGNRALPADEQLPIKRCPKCGYYQSWMSRQVAQGQMGQRLTVPFIISLVIFSCLFAPSGIATALLWLTQADMPKLYDVSQLVAAGSCLLALLALVLPAAYMQLTGPQTEAHPISTGRINRPRKRYKVTDRRLSEMKRRWRRYE
jgi:Zn ribbon nucleic-acid-binding protein